jgi:hypothetical protein
VNFEFSVVRHKNIPVGFLNLRDKGEVKDCSEMERGGSCNYTPSIHHVFVPPMVRCSVKFQVLSISVLECSLGRFPPWLSYKIFSKNSSCWVDKGWLINSRNLDVGLHRLFAVLSVGRDYVLSLSYVSRSLCWALSAVTDSQISRRVRIGFVWNDPAMLPYLGL